MPKVNRKLSFGIAKGCKCSRGLGVWWFTGDTYCVSREVRCERDAPVFHTILKSKKQKSAVSKKQALN